MNMSETVGFKGAFQALQVLETSSKTLLEADEVLSLFAECGVENPPASLQDLVAANLLARNASRFAISSLGIRTALLLEAINGGDLRDVYRRLTHLESSLHTYELVREGMTKSFLRNLSARPGFVRLYFCSPWISLDSVQEGMLKHAILTASGVRGNQPEILVITRPEEKTDSKVPGSLEPFKNLGASIFLNKRLHTKLYIREPDTRGGYSMAILGSQNLTKSNYLELGIRVNGDSQMINQLIAYFFEITNYSHEA